jgi:hypothetical protein
MLLGKKIVISSDFLHVIVDDWLHLEFQDLGVANSVIRDANSIRLDLAFVIDEKLANSTSHDGEEALSPVEEEGQVDQETGIESLDDNSCISLLPSIFYEMRSKWLAYEPATSIVSLFDSIDDFLSLNSHCTITRLRNQDLEIIVRISYLTR